MFRIISVLAVAVIVCASGFLQAQESEGFPVNRMRWERDDSIPGFQPQPTYSENRIVIRNVDLTSDDSGMDISGKIFTDFEVDGAPSDAKLRQGQVMGLKITVELYEFSSPFKRKAGIVQHPKLDPINFGRRVDGQSVTVNVEDESEGFGTASFELPHLERPLPPGVYRLIASIHFGLQDVKVQQSIKYCAHWYGSEMVYDPVLTEYIEEDVLSSPELHETKYQEILNNLRVIRDEAVLYIGQTLTGEAVALRKKTSRSKEANYVVWTRHINIASWIANLERQIEAGPAYIKGQLEAKGLDPKEKKEILQQHKDSMARVAGLVAMYGGKLQKSELAMYSAALADRMTVLEQVMLFEEALTEQYWAFSDGQLLYGGFYPVNQRGSQAWEACANGDLTMSREKREEKLEIREKGEGGLKGFKSRREESAWKYSLPSIRKIAFKYLDEKIEKKTYDARNFCDKDDSGVILDEAKYEELRIKWADKFWDETEASLDKLNMSNKYAIAKWETVWREAKAARDACISLAYSWESYNLKKNQEIGAEAILANWKELNDGYVNDFSEMYKTAFVSPGVIKSNFDRHMAFIRTKTNQAEFRTARRIAIDAKQ